MTQYKTFAYQEDGEQPFLRGDVLTPTENDAGVLRHLYMSEFYKTDIELFIVSGVDEENKTVTVYDIKDDIVFHLELSNDKNIVWKITNPDLENAKCDKHVMLECRLRRC